jgi:hypothetical protein
MHSNTVSLLPRFDMKRFRWIQRVPAIASLASLASSAPHDSCNSMQGGADCCNFKCAAMTHPMTQAPSHDGCCDANERFASYAPTTPTFAPCRVVLLRLVKDHKVALGPTRANVANRPTFPPVVGTSELSGQGGGCGNSRAFKHSLFCLSGFS